MPPLMQSKGRVSASPVIGGGVVYTANASPRVRTVCRSSGGVRGSERRNATNRSLAEGNEQRGAQLAREEGKVRQMGRVVLWADRAHRRGRAFLRVNTPRTAPSLEAR